MEHESQKRKLEETSCDQSNEPVQCVNNCGFFGTPQNDNYCSKCYKEVLLKQSNENRAVVVDRSGGDGKEVVVNVGEVKEVSRAGEGGSAGNSNKPPANRCGFCRKKVGLTGFKCRCGETFCSVHRYSDKHNCVFDYKGAGQEAIAKANPVVKPDKVKKI